MSIEIVGSRIRLIDLKTRMPFKYGIATMTEAPYAFVEMRVRVNGVDEIGLGADLLPPKWFTKVPEKPLDAEIDEMLLVIEHAVKIARRMKAETTFALWRQLWDEQDRWGHEEGLPPLLTHFGTSLVERGLIEAVCRAEGKPFAEMLESNQFGIRLDSIHPELKGKTPSKCLRRPALWSPHLIARHTVGLADPLVDEDIPPAERLNDGLPQSLVTCIRAYGLQHFKIKVKGVLAEDRDRLARVVALLVENKNIVDSYWLGCTLDGNEQFRSLDAFQDYWRGLTADPKLGLLFNKLLFVEQPFHRDIALSPEALGRLKEWSDRPSMIIDESDADLTSVSQALALGYRGSSHKNCKGVFKSIANACLLRRHMKILSGEDLANVGPVALLQDLAVCAALGIDSVERNGHHYFAGLSQFPFQIWCSMLEHHGDLYHPMPGGCPTLTIGHGTISLASVRSAPFGVRPRINLNLFSSLRMWRKDRASKAASGKKDNP